MSIRFAWLQLNRSLAGLRAFAKHVLALSIVIGPVTNVKSGPRQFPGRFVVAVIGRVRLAQPCDGQAGLSYIFATLIKRFRLSQLVGRHLGVGPARTQGAFRSAVI